MKTYLKREKTQSKSSKGLQEVAVLWIYMSWYMQRSRKEKTLSVLWLWAKYAHTCLWQGGWYVLACVCGPPTELRGKKEFESAVFWLCLSSVAQLGEWWGAITFPLWIPSAIVTLPVFPFLRLLAGRPNAIAKQSWHSILCFLFSQQKCYHQKVQSECW